MVDLTAPATEEEIAVLRRLGLEPTAARTAVLRQGIVTVAAWKGGVGKTELAKELAWLLNAVMVDLDWDAGGASRKWGYNHETRLNAPLLDAFENNRIPKPLQGGEWRADLVPSHPDLEKNQPSPDQVSAALEKWRSSWERSVLADTHPGGTDVGYGAMSASHVIVVPTPLGINELEALEAMVKELRGYPLLIVPNQNLYKVPSDKMFDRLGRIAEQYSVPLGPPITFCRWLPERTRRMAVAASEPVPARFQEYAEQVTLVARTVVELIAKQMGEEG
ncbi:ParA family protein [Nocardia sp. NPDC051570]|uniref:ParA family protein n=1 Tax=Nocardia sp. NPDC051570 TaxID=3364324 RepID=UPI0037987024